MLGLLLFKNARESWSRFDTAGLQIYLTTSESDKTKLMRVLGCRDGDQSTCCGQWAVSRGWWPGPVVTRPGTRRHHTGCEGWAEHRNTAKWSYKLGLMVPFLQVIWEVTENTILCKNHSSQTITISPLSSRRRGNVVVIVNPLSVTYLDPLI